MVALITNGHSTDRRGRPFRRRHTIPALIAVGALVALVLITWSFALSRTADTVAATACNAPSAADSAVEGEPAHALGTRADGTILRTSSPAPLWDTPVRVFNANGQSGQAAQVAAQFSDIGFAPAPDNQVSNDPVYTKQNLQCQGQIRYGEAGEAAANTVWLAMPCAELIRDSRTDNTVDVALGTLFNDVSPNADADALLKTLRVDAGEPAPALDENLIDGAHAVRC
ncbi:envelope integrity protein Cei [Tomitella biformata]|uniref:envelope integrity protein Cei n=1 Tax=Tomitella biformata TaxID=630403 RepID=UPI0004641AF6|nr:envelope integrity protein Cei [Tomitella biformata]